MDQWIEMVFRRGWTRACLNDDGRIPPERELEIDKVCEDWTNFIEAQFQKQNWDGIKETFRSRSEFVNFNDRGWNIKLISIGGGADGKRNGSGESDGTNLVRMCSSLSSKRYVIGKGGCIWRL